MPDFSIRADIAKASDEQRIAYGWASIVEVGGKPQVDWDGDIHDERELTKAMHDFMSSSRTGGYMHKRLADGTKKRVGEVVELAVFGKAMQKALGIDLGKTGVWIGFKVHDDEVWKRVKDGTLPAFSIGGKGKRRRVEA